MSIYDRVRTDSSVEQQGIVLDYGQFRVTVARAGGANKKYAAILEAKSRPYRRALASETLSPDIAEKILREVYVEAVIQKWEVKKADGTWIEAVDLDGDAVIPATKDNIAKTLADPSLNWLFTDIQAQATQVALYRAVVAENETKN